MDKEVVEIYLDDIIPNRFQPREVFNEEALRELSESIRMHGVIQPIIVRKIGDKYEIIAGERRYKASTLAGLTKIPAIIRNIDDKEASKVALLENLQRKDLTAIEEARTYQKILELDNMTQEELGRTMGKSQGAIANKMRLLSLPDEIQEALLHDRISERHARSLLNLDTIEEQINMLNRIINERMTVRELDNEIKDIKDGNIPSIKDDVVTTIVNEAGPKIEVSSEAPKEEIDDDDDTFKFDFSKLELLDDDDEDSSNQQNIEIKEPVKENEELKDIYGEEDKMQEQERIDFLLKQTRAFTLKDAVRDINQTVDKLKSKGFDIRVDEMDFENTYQVVIKIDKDK